MDRQHVNAGYCVAEKAVERCAKRFETGPTTVIELIRIGDDPSRSLRTPVGPRRATPGTLGDEPVEASGDSPTDRAV